MLLSLLCVVDGRISPDREIIIATLAGGGGGGVTNPTMRLK